MTHYFTWNNAVRRELLVCVLLLLSVLVFLPGEVKAAATIYSTQTGPWQDTATWLGGVVPGTTDTAYICDGHTVLLNDNRTVFQIGINSTATLLIRGSVTDVGSIGWTVTLKFDDAASSGFLGASAGHLEMLGDETNNYPVTITTADATPPPTNYWTGTPAVAGMRLTMRNATTSYGKGMSHQGAVLTLDNVSMLNLGSTGIAGFYFLSLSAGTSMKDITLTGTKTYGFYGNFGNAGLIDNLDLSGGTWNVGDIRLGTQAEFINSNFDTSSIACLTNGRIYSDVHDDVANAYKIIIKPATSRSKSEITNDFTTGDNIELVSGTFTIDEASASNDFTVDSGATLTLNTGQTHRFDDQANFTVNGLAKLNGVVDTASGYFDFYNTGHVWLNDSTVTDADLVLTFDFYIAASNSTLNYYTANVNFAILFEVSSETYAAKDTGVVWHMNATYQAPSAFEVVEFDFGNLTTGEVYELYNNGVLVYARTANAGGMAYFITVIDDTTDHLYLTHEAVAEEEEPEKKAALTCDFQATVKGHRAFFEASCNREDALIFHWIWDFGDGTVVYGESFIEHEYSQAGSYNVSLEVIDYEGRRAFVSKTIKIVDAQLIPEFGTLCCLGGVAIIIVILAALFVAASSERKKEEVSK